MFLLILESIGTSELILIAVVALIVFGPRKLPQMAKTLGKTMAEFKNATSEFRSTWEREVAFEEESGNKMKDTSLLTDTVAVETPHPTELSPVSAGSDLAAPEIKELSSEEAQKLFQKEQEKAEIPQPEQEEQPVPTKRDWL